MPIHLSRTQRKALRKRCREKEKAKQRRFVLLRSLGQVFVFLLGFVGGGTFVEIYRARPKVVLLHLDSKDPLRFPIRVVNDQEFLTFYQVQPTSSTTFHDPDSSFPFFANVLKGAPKTIGTIDPMGLPTDILPISSHTFSFNIRFLPFNGVPDDLALHVKVNYQIRLVPFVHWSRSYWPRDTDFDFRVMKDSNGTPYWVED